MSINVYICILDRIEYLTSHIIIFIYYYLLINNRKNIVYVTIFYNIRLTYAIHMSLTLIINNNYYY